MKKIIFAIIVSVLSVCNSFAATPTAKVDTVAVDFTQCKFIKEQTINETTGKSSIKYYVTCNRRLYTTSSSVYNLGMTAMKHGCIVDLYRVKNKIIMK